MTDEQWEQFERHNPEHARVLRAVEAGNWRPVPLLRTVARARRRLVVLASVETVRWRQAICAACPAHRVDQDGPGCDAKTCGACRLPTRQMQAPQWQKTDGSDATQVFYPIGGCGGQCSGPGFIA